MTTTTVVEIAIPDEASREALTIALWHAMYDTFGDGSWSDQAGIAGWPPFSADNDWRSANARAAIDEMLTEAGHIRRQIRAVEDAPIGERFPIVDGERIARELDYLANTIEADGARREYRERRSWLLAIADAARSLVEVIGYRGRDDEEGGE